MQAIEKNGPAAKLPRDRFLSLDLRVALPASQKSPMLSKMRSTSPARLVQEPARP